MTPTPASDSMPCFLRRWVARANHEGLLRSELMALHAEYAARHAHLVEATLYREHFTEREFLGVAVYDTDEDADSDARADLLRAFERVERVHAEGVAQSLRIETVYEYRALSRNGTYGAAAVVRCSPGDVGRLTERLAELASDVVERLGPTRVLVHRAIGEPGLFFAICDAETPIDVGRYLASSLWREHHAALGSLLIERPRWYSLDPIWHYFRRQRLEA
jgi:hypothetical protein